MRKMIPAILLLALAAVSNSALADWVKVGSNDTVIAYADASTIRKRGNIVKMWSLFDYKTERMLSDGSPYLSVMREAEFNCKDHVQHMISYSIHSGNMSKGKVLEKGGEPQDWKPVSQVNIALAMWKFACSKD